MQSIYHRRSRVVKAEKITLNELIKLSKSNNVSDRMRVAGYKECPYGLLEILAEDEDIRVLRNVA